MRLTFLLCLLRAAPAAADVNSLEHIPEDGVARIGNVSIARFRDGDAAQRAAQAAALRAALETQAMVILEDHGVPQPAIDDAMTEARKFFALPRAEKDRRKLPSGYPPRSDARVTSPRGWGYEVQDEHDGAPVNEWIMVRDNSEHADAARIASDDYYTCPEGAEFHSPESNHPEQQDWPAEVPHLRAAAEAYHRRLVPLVDTLYEMLALALGVGPDYFTSRAAHSPIWPVKIAHYPPQDPAAPPPPEHQRIAAHYDRTLFSLITTDDPAGSPGGLQILVDRDTEKAVDSRFAENAVWRHVGGHPGKFVLNVGEMLARWTNERFRHVVHRVPNPKNATDATLSRMSLLAFVIPDYVTAVEPLPTCVEPGAAPLYEATWVGELYNWGSTLDIYDKEKQELMRQAQGLYNKKGGQTTFGTTTSITELLKARAEL